MSIWATQIRLGGFFLLFSFFFFFFEGGTGGGQKGVRVNLGGEGSQYDHSAMSEIYK